MNNITDRAGQALSAQQARVMLEEWTFFATAPGAVEGPTSLNLAEPDWAPARRLSEAILAPNCISDPDAFDCWFRLVFHHRPSERCQLVFEGLATLAEVYLNGVRILTTRNMFRRYSVDLSQPLQETNELLVVCRSLGADLQKKRPRPGWKTNLVVDQSLRWHRTTLLGRTAGWGYEDKIVGPWRPIRLIEWQGARLDELTLKPSASEDTARLRVEASLTLSDEGPVHEAWVEVGNERLPLNVEQQGLQAALTGEDELPSLVLWWPHTHGTPDLHDCRLLLRQGSRVLLLDERQIGFRSTELRGMQDAPELIINGQRVFARGACWTGAGAEGPVMSADEMTEVLHQMAEAGANLIRIGGTMFYESEFFYRLCDKLGLMVWQDFMFANMDYRSDENFEEEVHFEIRQQVARLAPHASVVVLCGNSEVEQQAVMMGQPVDTARLPLFYETIPEICHEITPGVPYVPGSPSIGGLPFHSRVGIAHYFGVGAYERPINDHSLYEVGFTTECLGFSNVSAPGYTRAAFGTVSPPVHDPAWKRGVARDAKAGWDFEDVRDYYLRELFRLDPIELRTRDNARYLALSRVVTGEIMSLAYAVWRGERSRCNGALIWHLKDLLPGAGWGVLDAAGGPKPVYWYLKRAWAPRAVLLEDGGLEGAFCHVLNDAAAALDATLELLLVGDSRHCIAETSTRVQLEPGAGRSYSVDDLLGRFYDSAYAYRFGPPSHQVVGARLVTTEGEISQACLFPAGYDLPGANDAAVEVTVEQLTNDDARLVIEADRFLQSVALEPSQGSVSNNYFHVLPGIPTVVHLFGAVETLRGQLSALNMQQVVRWRA